MSAQHAHGGARKGAGRPSEGREQVVIRLKPEAAELLRGLAEDQDCALGEIVEDLLNNAVAAAKLPSL